ncbi:plasmid mobilization relaxosome protein MobC [Nesterenkonia sp.]|uniref:plasmid mobilization relaxosome protein MobC n=1 Tax=Nesterenkonia sp. TaxID=704201 RepID=UPI0026050976|nr:plasmid mobilization relaxosome protein MobC [Nesterenkonia sp.]
MLKLTEFEDNALYFKAQEQNVSVQRLLVESALTFESGDTATNRKAAVQSILRAERQLAAIGNNLNQIARGVNAGAPVSAELHHSLEFLRGVLMRLDDAASSIAKVGVSS